MPVNGKEIVFTPNLRAPSLAREASAAAFRGTSSGFLDDLALLVSELVTNCVKHGGLKGEDRIRLVFNVFPDRARVEVIQPGPPFAHRSAHLPSHDVLEGGLGLRIVDSLAERWGVSGPPCTVWFELAMEQG